MPDLKQRASQLLRTARSYLPKQSVDSLDNDKIRYRVASLASIAQAHLPQLEALVELRTRMPATQLRLALVKKVLAIPQSYVAALPLCILADILRKEQSPAPVLGVLKCLDTEVGGLKHNLSAEGIHNLMHLCAQVQGHILNADWKQQQAITSPQ